VNSSILPFLRDQYSGWSNFLGYLSIVNVVSTVIFFSFKRKGSKTNSNHTPSHLQSQQISKILYKGATSELSFRDKFLLYLKLLKPNTQLPRQELRPHYAENYESWPKASQLSFTIKTIQTKPLPNPPGII